MSRGGNKYSDTVLGNDGKLYGIPAGSLRVMCIDPNSDTFTLMGGDPIPVELLQIRPSHSKSGRAT
jgi:hypothetical protein